MISSIFAQFVASEKFACILILGLGEIHDYLCISF